MFDLKKIIQRENVGFNRELGIRLLDVCDSFTRAEIEINEKHLNPYGIVHGGCIFSLMDTVGGIAASTQGNAVTTSSCSISFLNAGNGKKLIAQAEKIKNGKNLLVYDVIVTDENETLIAKSTLTYFRLPIDISADI